MCGGILIGIGITDCSKEKPVEINTRYEPAENKKYPKITRTVLTTDTLADKSITTVFKVFEDGVYAGTESMHPMLDENGEEHGRMIMEYDKKGNMEDMYYMPK